MPAGALDTLPGPLTASDRVAEPGRATKPALTWVSPFRVTWQPPVPLQAPPQPPNEVDCPGVAVRVTTVPIASTAVHAPGQAIPPVSEVTRPSPVTPTVSVAVAGGAAVR